ncbi:2-amino-4-hydroxy-6-hydroxymethyldihydropteridine diphosphokinase [Exilibacterium tricleocarpae]|uniref:2-amino-4-hydroxy-6-hydroxymethyldihydropteridine diphosphokinase n=2 Tax=Exilibacterium tricleocarpae TaxID=2591008 RepID=A0A545T3R2_9GAMM|nr:2-amino-4-hydroxy-6-hydroxymethyldihydropteridine diphosphokinase [Exilibacterium tricleocarpae]TQV71861.1 2-amino-4-hydroxy-6-hydroxymethyldihydropteridine diphosphokinase [Exilibacterium tricleocarpae]
MARVYLSIGSNIDRHRHISACLDALHQTYGELLLSSVYESEAVGFAGDNFFNLVAGIDTSLGVGELAGQLRHIETANGRRRDGPRFSSRTLDIDILTYGDVAGTVDGVALPRDEVTKNAFVLWPLAEIAPQVLHPVLKCSYGELWERYDKRRQQLWIADFSWRGQQFSRAALK